MKNHPVRVAYTIPRGCGLVQYGIDLLIFVLFYEASGIYPVSI
jgi:hypothetical protein